MADESSWLHVHWENVERQTGAMDGCATVGGRASLHHLRAHWPDTTAAKTLSHILHPLLTPKLN